jgi:two-component system OmpR family sensor kinase
VRIRLKLAILFSAVTLVLLIGAGLLFVGGLRSGLQNSMDNSLRTQADEVSSQLATQHAGGDPLTVTVLRLGATSYGQILTSSGRVLASTSDALDRPLLTPAQAAAAAATQRLFDRRVTPSQPAVSDPSSVSVRVLAGPSGRAGVVIAVATSREVVDEATERAAKQLLIVGAIVLAIAGPGAWLLARGALRPVERLRVQAAELQAKDAGGGLSVPGTRDEMSRLAETLNALLGRLHDALERERAFVADAGHELRTPLTVLRGELELARRPGRSREELADTVEIASEETERLIQLTEDLLVLARDEDVVPTRLQDFDLVPVVDAAIAAMSGRSATGRELDISIEAVMPPALDVRGDPARIRQALDNLLSNAVRFSPPGSTVQLEARIVSGAAEVTVLDQGPGFPPDFLPVAFERFRRGDVSRTRAGDVVRDDSGSGLGLAIVRSVMRGHHGSATASNLPTGVGARVTLRWPL